MKGRLELRHSPKLLVGLVAVGLVLSGCSSSKGNSGGNNSSSGASNSTNANKSPITIPLVGQITGPFAFVGGSTLEGAKLAVKQINAAGGVDGHPVVLQALDSQGDPTKAVAAFQSILTSGTKPPAMIEAESTQEMLAADSLLAQGGVPIVSAISVVPGLNNVTLYATVPDTNGYAQMLVKGYEAVTHSSSLSGKKFAVVELADNAASALRADAITKLVQQEGGTVVRSYKFPITSTTFGQGADLVSSGADGLLVDYATSGATIITKAVTVAGFKGTVIESSGGSTDAYFQAAGASNVYGMRVGISATPGTAIYDVAKAAGADMTAAAGPYFTTGYGAAFTVADTLAACGLPCPQTKFTSTLKSLGDIHMTTQAYYGSLNFSGGGQSGTEFAQPFQWDATTKKAVPVGNVVTFK